MVKLAELKLKLKISETALFWIISAGIHEIPETAVFLFLGPVTGARVRRAAADPMSQGAALPLISHIMLLEEKSCSGAGKLRARERACEKASSMG